MSIGAISNNPVLEKLPMYFHQRSVDLKQMSQDLKTGNLSAVEQDFNSIQSLAQNGPLPNGEAFILSWRQQDFANVGQALQAGDLVSAQQAFAQLAATFGHKWSPTETGSAVSSNSGNGLNVSA